MEAVALLNTIHYSLAEMKAETPVSTLPDVDTNASPNTMADRLAGVKAAEVGETLTDLKVAAPVLKLVATLTGLKTKTVGKTLEVEPKTLSIKLGDVMMEALIDALADTVAAVEAKTL